MKMNGEATLKGHRGPAKPVIRMRDAILKSRHEMVRCFSRRSWRQGTESDRSDLIVAIGKSEWRFINVGNIYGIWTDC